MFRFHLVKDQHFGINVNKRPQLPLLLANYDYQQWLEADVNFTPMIQLIENTDLSRKLKALVENQTGTGVQGFPTYFAGVYLTPRNQPSATARIDFRFDHGTQETTDFVKILDVAGETTVARLLDAIKSLGLEVKVVVEIKNLRGRVRNGNWESCADVKTEEVDILEFTKGRGVGGQEGVPFPLPPLWKTRIMGKGLRGPFPLCGTITIFCTAYPKDRPLSESNTKQCRFLRKMLDEGTNSDATIVAADGEEIKCHKFILIDQSDVLEATFKTSSNSKESITGTIKVDDMCSKSVKAFLAFLYLDDIGEAGEDSDTALDLLKAAHKYHVSKLEERIKNLLLTKPDKWFNLEVAMHLYFFVKNLPEDGEALKRKALGVMQLSHSSLNASPGYIRLFKEEPEAARELTSELIAYLSKTQAAYGDPSVPEPAAVRPNYVLVEADDY